MISYVAVPTLTTRFVSHRHMASRPDNRDLFSAKVCSSVHRHLALESVLSQINAFRIITLFLFKYTLYYYPIYDYVSQVVPCLQVFRIQFYSRAISHLSLFICLYLVNTLGRSIADLSLRQYFID